MRISHPCAAQAVPPDVLPKGFDENIVDYHTTPYDVGKLATDARVETVVLTHLIPPSTS